MRYRSPVYVRPADPPDTLAYVRLPRSRRNLDQQSLLQGFPQQPPEATLFYRRSTRRGRGRRYPPIHDGRDRYGDYEVYGRVDLDGTPDLDDLRTPLSFEIG